MHRLLQRQIKRHFGSADQVPDELQGFIAAVNDAYRQSDADRALLERSLDLTSEELVDRNEQLRQQQTRLEQLVKERTAQLERRAVQLQAAAEVARDAAVTRDLDTLLGRAANLIRDRFGFYHVGLYLVDEQSQSAILTAATGEAGRRLLERGHQLKVGETSVVGRAVKRGQPDSDLDATTAGSASGRSLFSETRSEVAVPLRVADKTIGVLDVHSRRANAFDEDEIVVLQTMADQLAVAIQNVRLLGEQQQTLRELEAAYQRFTAESWREFVRMTRQRLGYRYRGLGVEPLTEHRAEAATALQEGRTVVAAVPDPAGEEPSATTSAVAVPIKLREQVLGVLNVRFQAEAISPDMVALVEEGANRLALVLENARLLDEAQQRAVREQLAGDVTARIRETLDVEAILRTAAQEVRQALGVPEVVVRLTSPSNGPEPVDGDSHAANVSGWPTGDRRQLDADLMGPGVSDEA